MDRSRSAGSPSTTSSIVPAESGVLSPHDSLPHAGHRLLATGLPALPVRAMDDGALRVVTTTRLLAALLAGGARP